MTRLRQCAVAAVALTLSGGLHAAGLVRLTPDRDVALQGGIAEALPTLGDSFADMAQGAALTAPPPEMVTPDTTVQPIPPVAQAVAVPPVHAAAVPLAQPVKPMDNPLMAALAPVSTQARARPVIPQDRRAALPEAATAAPDQSLRPQPRPERAAPETAARQQARAAPQGNADRNATRGTNAGREGAVAAVAQSRQATAQGDGGAAASASYGRAVLTQISRTRKARAPARGRTVVAFSISDGGALASVKVLQSSGSSDLDRVALDHIRRAAPFPKPPAGVRRQFSFEFVGRS